MNATLDRADVSEPEATAVDVYDDGLFRWHRRTPAQFPAFFYTAAAYHDSLKISRLKFVGGPIVLPIGGFPVGVSGD